VKLPLRILGVISHPDDRDQLDVAAEREALSAAVAPLGADHVQLHWLEGSGWEHLWRASRSEPWHILHFIGHGGFDDARGEGFLEFVDENGGARHVYATDLGRLLHDNTSLRLAVLNACESGRAAGGDTFASPAASIIRRGFPAAVAMQYEISDPAALVFAQAFYGAIAAGEPLDRAVTDARTTVHMTQPGSLEWGTPVLYLRSKNANVFEVKDASPPAGTAAPAGPASAPPAAATDTTLSKAGIDGLRRATDLMRSLASGTVRSPQAVGKASVRPPPPVTRSAEIHPATSPAPEPVVPQPVVSVPVPPPDSGVGVTETHRFTHPGPVNAVAFDPVHRRVFAAGEYGEILCWDLDQARVSRCCRIADRPAAVRSLAVAPDGRYLAAAHDDQVVRVWDVDTEVVALTIRPPAGHAGRSVRISAAEGLLVIGCTGGVAMVADRHGMERTRLVHRPEADDGGGLRPPGDVYAVAFSPDSHWIATGAADGLVRIFGPDGRVVERLPHPAPVLDVAFRPDGRALGTGAADGNARLWDPRGNIRSRLSHDAEVGSVAFSADSLRLVTGSGDGSARVWGADEGVTARTVAGGPVAAVAVHPGSAFVMATAHADHTVRIWTLADDDAGPAGEKHE
jgi:WD40 repeat protein